MTTEADHLNALELSLTEEQAKTNWIENQLNRLLALLDPTRENAEPAPPGEALSIQTMDEDTLLKMNMARGFQMRPSNLSDLTATKHTFQNKQACISWALTFFKTGQAASFPDQILRTQASIHVPYFANWNTFETEFKK
ncbi:hypothetical protein M422DRAFT_275776 [Sphaerobolus stellatus SS14]|uniref:Uncharacterized protein n=1 Tax=Sphaerobolus stellatus (strain SS14) TaxID=990650 RepID=A0A0C9UEG3_SPHS4|nr:hypothetical protein M422DRAFT_275776 [Sphaerobolus stellatus SS14]